VVGVLTDHPTPFLYVCFILHRQQKPLPTEASGRNELETPDRCKGKVVGENTNHRQKATANEGEWKVTNVKPATGVRQEAVTNLKPPTGIRQVVGENTNHRQNGVTS